MHRVATRTIAFSPTVPSTKLPVGTTVLRHWTTSSARNTLVARRLLSRRCNPLNLSFTSFLPSALTNTNAMTTTGRSFVPEKQSRYNNNTPGDGSSDEYTAHQQPTDETRMNAVMKGDSQIDAGGTAAATAANDDNNSDNPIDDERDPGEVPGTSLRILKYPHPLLRAENTEIDVASDMEPTRQAAREMLKVMYASQGVGLAAPQVGLNEQLLVFNPEGDSRAFLQEVVMVNPKIVATSKKTEVEKEACLSFPGMSGDVKRYEWVKVEGWRLNGKKFKVKLEGWKARIFQHEYDHLNGVVYIDHLDEENRNNIRERLDQLIEDYKQNPYEGIDPAL